MGLGIWGWRDGYNSFETTTYVIKIRILFVIHFNIKISFSYIYQKVTYTHNLDPQFQFSCSDKDSIQQQ